MPFFMYLLHVLILFIAAVPTMAHSISRDTQAQFILREEEQIITAKDLQDAARAGNVSRMHVLLNTIVADPDLVKNLEAIWTIPGMARWSPHSTSTSQFVRIIDDTGLLQIAANNHDLPMVKLLLAFGATVDHMPPEDAVFDPREMMNGSPLHKALGTGLWSAGSVADPEVVKVLLAAGADPNVVDQTGRTVVASWDKKGRGRKNGEVIERMLLDRVKAVEKMTKARSEL
jgi:hypothetical protein